MDRRSVLKSAAAAAAMPFAAGLATAPAAADAPSAPTAASALPAAPFVHGWFGDIQATETGRGSLLTVPAAVKLVDLWGSLSKYTDEEEEILKSHVATLKSRGHTVAATVWFKEGLDTSGLPYTPEGFDAYGRKMLDLCTSWGLDGIDVDVEDGIILDTDEQNIALFRAVGKYIGPKSDSGKLFICDTNKMGTAPLIRETADTFDLHILQRYWSSQSSIESTWASYQDLIDPHTYVLTANHEDGSALEPGPSGTQPRLYDYAEFVRDNGLGGVGSYRFNLEYDIDPTYPYMTEAARILEGTPASEV